MRKIAKNGLKMSKKLKKVWNWPETWFCSGEINPHMMKIVECDPRALLRPSKPLDKAFGFVRSFESMAEQGL